jgi:flagellar basal-body rod protein FlgC
MIDTLPGINTIASALSAERTRMDVVTQNIANANTTRTADGKVYQRQQVVFESLLQQQPGATGADAGIHQVRVARVQADPRPPRLVYNPGHPEANAEGMVAMPDINVYEEMVDLIAASRAYEANLAAFKNARSMALQTLAIGKRS